ncbi:50S ribosomal protein L25/general stress protein Ctc [Helicobacter sp. 16-1353]|uniref:50S ribosomal protein L25/general stress protein Ctc n=1 Tax=Helicobacter sp. 16-1353 TaxID=2004996 RepID=UPI000DCE279C|nr:50S ribosomal protein L25/general stress protein Ctc [Helicobacter sp. 16-1353]RAX54367.1 50S ribosomal protein L25/general stress protein Ctc [Helicobacter sp. 16-1353]
MLEGIIRESVSKSSNKALRNDGYLIANIYGKGTENIHCAFKTNEFIKTLKTKKGIVFQVKVGEKTLDVVVQEYQKDPVTSKILHVDLLLVQKGILTNFKIPVVLEGNAVGVKNKGILLFSKKRIAVKCLPENLVDNIKIDVTKLDIGDAILIRDLGELENIKIIEKPNVAIVGVIKAK